MFTKGSRYRNLPEFSPVDGAGERKRGKALRPMTVPNSRFLHTVQDNDRLDLMAYKYYGDGTRWWQIADANPSPAFPLDLLDRRPLVEEEVTLRPINFVTRLNQLLTDLGAIGSLPSREVTSWNVHAPPSFDASKTREPDFLETTVVVMYPPSPTIHQQIVDVINNDFHFLRSFAWSQGTNTAESFAFEDPVAKANWRALMARLNGAPGIHEVVSRITEAKLRIVYHPEMLLPDSLTSLITASGFAIEPGSGHFSRIGTSLRIPPNQ